MNNAFTSIDVEHLFYQAYRLLIGTDGLPAQEDIAVFWSRFQPASFLFSALLAALIVYTIVKLRQIRIAEREALHHAQSAAEEAAHGRTAEKGNEKWEHILELALSENPREWRLAILEADIILDSMVTRMGYRGDTLGEKLKSIEPSDFTTLNEAWEAHKVRNAIAHEGSDFILTQRETRRVIDLFKKVFEEFHYI